MNIDIKKFCNISNINIPENKQLDIMTGVTDILNYTNILNEVSNINKQSNKENYLKKVNEYRNSETNREPKEISQKIIFLNAPSLIELYFHVPNLITRK